MSDTEPEQCEAVHWIGMRCLRETGHDENHMGLISQNPDLYATWKPKETT